MSVGPDVELVIYKLKTCLGSSSDLSSCPVVDTSLLDPAYTGDKPGGIWPSLEGCPDGFWCLHFEYFHLEEKI